MKKSKNKNLNFTSCLLKDNEKLWEDRYVFEKERVNISPNEGSLPDEYWDYKDKYGAVLYSVNSLGEIQRYYESREEYIDSIRHLRIGGKI